MKIPKVTPKQKLLNLKFVLILLLSITSLLVCNILASGTKASAVASLAACTPTGTTYGTVSFSSSNTPANPINVQGATAAATYTMWVRMEVPSLSSSSPLLLNVNNASGTNCYAVPGSAFTTAYTSTQSAWTWVNVSSGLTLPTLNPTNNSLLVTGTQSGASLDSIEFLSDPNCNPNTTDCIAAASADTTPPTVSLTAPTNGQTVSGTTTLTANASDDVAVANVQFKLDGSNLGSTDTVSPYSYTWNTTGVSNGTHVLTAVATDTSNNTTTSTSVTVTVSNGTTTVIGDLDGDGHVTGHDLSILLSHYGTNYSLAELDGGTIVEGHDLSILLSHYGT